MSLIRGTSLTGYAELAAELGQDPVALLRAAGIRPADAGDHDAFVSYRSLVVALEMLAEVSQRPDVGLLLARRQGIDILGPVGVAARTAPTLAGALDVFSGYLSAYSPAIGVRATPTGDEGRVFLEFRVLVDDLPPHPQVVELSVAIAAGVVRFLVGSDYRPLQIHLPHAPMADPEVYRELLGGPIRFEARGAGLILRATDLDRQLRADAVAHAALVRYLDSLVPDGEPGIAGSVRALVRRVLPTGALSADLIAAQFRLHPKTLQRRLREEGTSFAAIVDDVRRATAEHYLTQTAMSLTQLTRELGYSEQSALSRSCRRWFGCGPRERRRRAMSTKDK